MRRRHTLGILVAAAGLLTVACSTKTIPPQPKHRTVVVTNGAMRFVPDLSGPERAAIADDVSTFLQTLYADAFIRPKAKGPTPVPDQYAAQRIAGFFTPAARLTLEQKADVFSLGPHLDLLAGQVQYSGGVTRDKNVITALLSVQFTGAGSRVDEAATVVEFQQTGQLLLQKSATGWIVREFDLKIALKPPPPTPTQT